MMETKKRTPGNTMLPSLRILVRPILRELERLTPDELSAVSAVIAYRVRRIVAEHRDAAEFDDASKQRPTAEKKPRSSKRRRG